MVDHSLFSIDSEALLKRYIGHAGNLELEILEPQHVNNDPYAAHLLRGSHGLVHVGGKYSQVFPLGEALECEWLEDKETFLLYDWIAGKSGLQEYPVRK